MKKSYRIEDPDTISFSSLFEDLKGICLLDTACDTKLLVTSSLSFRNLRELTIKELPPGEKQFIFVSFRQNIPDFNLQYDSLDVLLKSPAEETVTGIILSEEVYNGAMREFKVLEEKIPIIRTKKFYTEFKKMLFSYLSAKLAPYVFVHGSCVEVFGEGVLLMGKAGTGKSECVYELIRRGHNFIADDLIKLFHFPSGSIFATSGAQDVRMKTFIDLKYVGVLDLEMTLGPARMKEKTEISLIIELSEEQRKSIWEEEKDFFGIKIPSYIIPVSERARLATIIETLVLKYKLKKFGFDATKVVEEILGKRNDKETAR
ncbi:MAG: hypothetical protein ABIM43_03180 [candidate division WOR-3 bacterium]